MINFRGLSLFKERVDSLPLDQQFIKIALLFYGAEYEMGKENMNQCDCSGLICSTLTLMGYKIRINANDIINNLCDEIDFDIDNSKFNKGVRIIGFRDSNKIYKHIGIVTYTPSSLTLYHSSYPYGPATEDLDECFDRYRTKGKEPIMFKLNWDKVKAMSGTVYGLDEDLK